MSVTRCCSCALRSSNWRTWTMSAWSRAVSASAAAISSVSLRRLLAQRPVPPADAERGEREDQGAGDGDLLARPDAAGRPTRGGAASPASWLMRLMRIIGHLPVAGRGPRPRRPWRRPPRRPRRASPASNAIAPERVERLHRQAEPVGQRAGEARARARRRRRASRGRGGRRRAVDR